MAKVMKTMDGNTAAAHVAYAFTDVAAIYPITPSSPMAELVDSWSAHGRKNIFGQRVKLTEMQSEGGASGAVHGSLAAGALTTTFTASQGLLLMLPNMYKIAGELLPGVFHVSSRTVATHALSIFGDHSDVMAVRQTGTAMIASGSVQEVMDLAGVAHLASIKSSIPFVHFFDGFRTSHEYQKIEVMDYDDLAELVDYGKVSEFRHRALNPEHPVTKGTAQNPDIFFQAREASNRFYEAVPDIVEEYMQDISEITGREYHPFNYVGAEDAEYIIVAMGSVTDTIEETVNYLVNRGEKVGLIKVRLYRPFSEKYFFKAFPETTKKIAVLDRTKEPGAVGEPLYEDVRSLFYDRKEKPVIVGGRYGLSSKDTTPSQINAVFENLKKEEPKDRFTIGIIDDVTHTNLEIKEHISTTPEGTVRCKFWGFGSDGTVGANKNAIKIIGDNTDKYAQAYFSYDSKKSGGVTVSHLRFGDEPIKSTYLIDKAEYVACHKESYVDKFDMVSDLKEGGTFLLNCRWSEDELEENLPAEMKKFIAENNINFYIIDGVKIAQEVGLGGRINMVMQTAFFKLADIIPVDDAVKYLKNAIKDTYGHKGDKIVEMNYKAVDKALDALVKVDVPADWADAESVKEEEKEAPEFVKNVLEVVNKQEGDSLPVSTFVGREDGHFPPGLSQYEKRGIAIDVPDWDFDTCIQCNQCSLSCPHAVIRPFLLDEEEAANAPEGFVTVDANGKQLEGLQYKIQVSPYDCTGCGVCADICPADALEMKPFAEMAEKEAENWEYARHEVTVKDDLMPVTNIKGSQFQQPLLEFSGACAGCGETAYAKLVTQLFGDRMIIANATGCSSIWGGSAPVSVYTTNDEGEGPAWANSLFEDNAEYGYGMYLATAQIRDKIADLMQEAIELNLDPELNELMQEFLDNMQDGERTKELKKKMMPLLAKYSDNEVIAEIVDKKEFIVKKSQWIFGGDGWAYDIGYGGLDHVLASGDDVNVLVFDTEVYSNTGGQSSKATPTAAAAKFAASGKRIKKKDLGQMAMTYGYVYVAQIALGANMNQAIKAIAEAEAYPGPSLIIAYAPCIAHGLKDGMSCSVSQEKNAVESGYWHLYRFNPELQDEGKNPFSLDSKEPKGNFREHLLSEVRFSSLKKTFPEIAEELFERAEEDAKERYNSYKRLVKAYEPEE
ncbi:MULTISPECIES: pyruvate:ferredoxin (flavodoxin) oxidoreductase [unclassified Halanaerobium]|uniref:pyruvate:ferredoxin (flavodoxin) oxidoreductase n=1 Tax=unclassified Halanaerobium TaxID=2641197 RepID=UPI000DF271C6|nr:MULTISPECIES: pyruvate:ferredoxin (flavodoxin) oxidoreductase [unclassified Halanaerobium]RCW50737.1 pyruvate-ferredoxin/flavodoxin oxidoreductase [Halanaerobium sp. MA284_MarDTE_T2]RCW80177.1 pyruvate-ferredoxin/flavodoxin oxidoreductase [Halanaerobium sp. DL-01]